jgi:hypothetical protein
VPPVEATPRRGVVVDTVGDEWIAHDFATSNGPKTVVRALLAVALLGYLPVATVVGTTKDGRESAALLLIRLAKVERALAEITEVGPGATGVVDTPDTGAGRQVAELAIGDAVLVAVTRGPARVAITHVFSRTIAVDHALVAKTIEGVANGATGTVE